MPEENKAKKEASMLLYKIKDTILNFLIPLIAIVGTVLLLILYIMPSYKSLPVKKQELEGKITLKNTLTEKVSALNRLVDYKSVFDENSEIVNKVLVSEPEVPRLLDQASQMAEKAGTSLEKLSFSYSSKGNSSTGLDTVSVSMGVNSSFEQLIVFMELIENASRFVSVPSFRYSISDKTSEDRAAVSSTFSVDSPYLFVQSSAVTDDPIKIDVTSNEFLSFMSMLKELDYYDFINKNIQAEEEKLEEVEEAEESVQATEETTDTDTIDNPTENANNINPTNPVQNTTPVTEAPVEPEETQENSIFPTQ